MLKKNLVIITIAALVLGAGAYAWAEDAPSRPTTSASVAADPPASTPSNPAPAGKGGKHAGVLRRVVHGDLVVRTKKGFENMTYDRGTVSAVSATSITVQRPDGVSVTKTIDANTRFRGAQSASDVKSGSPAIVLSKGGAAVLIAQRAAKAGGGNENAA